jgi:hypothetical protein
MKQRIETRDNKKVIVEENVRPYIDGIYWKINIVRIFQDGPDMLRLTISHKKSDEDSHGCLSKDLFTLDAHAPYKPDQVIEFATVCKRKIADYKAEPYSKFEELFWGKK